MARDKRLSREALADDVQVRFTNHDNDDGGQRGADDRPLRDEDTLEPLPTVVDASPVEGANVNGKKPKKVMFEESAPVTAQPNVDELMDDLAVRPDLSKAASYARRVMRYHEKLKQEREAASSRRTELAHLESVVQSKKEFVIESLDLVVEAVLRADITRASSKAAADIRHLRDTLESDLRALKERRDKLTQAQEKMASRDTGLQQLEDKCTKALETVLQNLEVGEEGDAEDGSETSDGSAQHDPATIVPPEIEQFLDKVGDRNILYEKLIELEAEHNEELGRREILSEQDRPVSPGVARQTDATYTTEHEELREALRQADAEMKRRYERCDKLGLQPERYLAGEPIENAEDSIGGSALDAGNSSGLGYDPVLTDPTIHTATDGSGYILIDERRARVSGIGEYPAIPRVLSPVDSDKVARWLSKMPGQSAAALELSATDVSPPVSDAVSDFEEHTVMPEHSVDDLSTEDLEAKLKVSAAHHQPEQKAQAASDEVLAER